MKSFNNNAKNRFLLSIPTASIEAPDDPLPTRCKFNFSYFEKQPAGQSFEELDQQTLASVFAKLKEFSKESLDYWRNQRAGKSGTIYSVYGGFPSRSDFVQPRHVPFQAEWGRFRLDWASRLCGFTVPKSYDGWHHKGTGRLLCANTFYIVFVDENHRFYKSASEAK
jgi:hypothetical protein